MTTDPDAHALAFLAAHDAADPFTRWLEDAVDAADDEADRVERARAVKNNNGRYFSIMCRDTKDGRAR
jgi:hypothetical protein